MTPSSASRCRTCGHEPAVTVRTMSPTAASLLVTLELKHRRGSEAAHRLARLRPILEQAIRDLTTGTKDERVVRAELEARGVRV